MNHPYLCYHCHRCFTILSPLSHHYQASVTINSHSPSSLNIHLHLQTCSTVTISLDIYSIHLYHSQSFYPLSIYWRLTICFIKYTVERLRLRLQIRLNPTLVSIWLNFGLAYCLFHRNSSTATKSNWNMRLMLEINKRVFLNCHVIHSSLIKSNECMKYHFVKEVTQSTNIFHLSMLLQCQVLIQII